METFIQLIVTGFAFGFLYSLVAIEYTLIYSSCRLINFAHASAITLGAYFFGFLFVGKMSLSFWVSAVLSVIVMGLIGTIISIVIYIPLGKIASLYAMLATIMFGTAIIEIIHILFTPLPFRVKGFLTKTVKISSATTTEANIWIICVGAIVVVLLLLFLHKTKIGKAMRCVAESRDTAEYMGINTNINISITVALSYMICTIIGILIVPLYSVRTTMVGTMGLKGFAAGIVGSYGSIPGAILGGILIGLLENFAVMVMPATYKDVTAFALVLVVLLIKPTGLLGGLDAKRLARIALREQKEEAVKNG